MHWNHRVVNMKKDNGGEDWLSIQEVYYNEAGEPCGYCDPCLGGDDLSELMTQVKRWAQCLKLPILDAETDFESEYEDKYFREEF
jgi:hypothetical protein